MVKERFFPKDSTITVYPKSSAVVGLSEKVAIGYIGYRSKSSFYYKFSSNESRDQYVAKWLESAAKEVEERKKRQEARHNFTNPFKVGDVVYDSWGYEQTNIDFYLVIEVKPKSVVLRPVGSKITASSGNDMAGYATPAPNIFTGKPILKKLQGVLERSGESIGHISSEFGCMSLYDGQPKYCSWYA